MKSSREQRAESAPLVVNSQLFALRSLLKGLQVCMKKYPEYWLKMKHG